MVNRPWSRDAHLFDMHASVCMRTYPNPNIHVTFTLAPNHPGYACRAHVTMNLDATHPHFTLCSFPSISFFSFGRANCCSRSRRDNFANKTKSQDEGWGSLEIGCGQHDAMMFSLSPSAKKAAVLKQRAAAISSWRNFDQSSSN